MTLFQRITWRWMVVCLLSLSLLGAIRFVDSQEHTRLTDIPCSLQTGDIVLLGSRTLRGLLVRMTNSTTSYAHVAMVECNENGCFLLHADPHEGCIAESVQDYFSRNNVSVLTVLRPTVSEQAVHQAVVFVRDCVSRHLPFNHKLKYGMGAGVYCTELIMMAFEQAQCPLFENVKQGDLIRPEKLLKSASLEIVDVQYVGKGSMQACFERGGAQVQ